MKPPSPQTTSTLRSGYSGRHHRGRQARAHGRERVVEQQRVRNVGSIVSCEPDLVHAVIKRDDAILGNDFSYVMHDALGSGRPAIFRGTVGDTVQNTFAKAQQRAGIMQPPFDTISQQFKAWPDISDYLALWKVDEFDVGRRIADMDDLRALRAHDEGRLLDGVVPDGDDQVGAVNRLMHIIALAERGRAHVQIAAAGNGSFAHLGREIWNFRAAHEAADSCRAAWTRRGSAEHDQWPLGFQDHLGGTIERCAVCDRNLDRMLLDHRDIIGFFACDVLRQFQQNRTRPLLHGDTKGVANERRDAAGADDLARQFGEWLECRDDVHDLESRLPTAHDAFLSRQHHHWLRAEQGVGRSRRKVQRTGTKRSDANAWLAGQTSVSRGHEGRTLLVTCKNQFDR